ncbi:MAG: family 78 glycoside hydrolase catalytic domain [Anaerolineales bacterium]|nr:family 78 glycoside hydrolase catalytic domain [Anaerolineales bacterium]
MRLRVAGAAGMEITVRHAEVLEPDGNLYITNLRTARATDRFILTGGGEELFEPHFTFHGFRYVGITGWPGALDAASLVGVVLHSDMAQTGEFSTSNPLINQLQHNIEWGQRGNFLDVPTDCPQRDERLGWTGDAQIFARTATFNFDVASFFTKWLSTVADDQYPNGAVTWVSPDVLKGVDVIVPGVDTAGATGWGDAITVIPWLLYQVYGDERILAEHYAHMVAWVEYMHRQEPEELRFGAGFHFGDWVALDTMVDGNIYGATDVELIGTAYFAYSTDIVAKAARVLGRQTDAQAYEDLHRRIVAYFQREFLTPSGRLASNTQTAYILALTFDLLLRINAPKQRAALSNRSVARDATGDWFSGHTVSLLCTESKWLSGCRV